MTQDIDEIIKKKIWTVENILSEVDGIVEKSKSLSPSERKKISTTISDWSEDNIKKYIDILKEAVINPLKHKNKEKIKKIGVDIEKIPEMVFDNTNLIDGIITLFEGIRNIDNKLTNILIGEQLIENVLKNIPDKIEIEQKRQAIVGAGSELKEIVEKEINEQFKHKLLKRVLEDVSFLEEAEEIISNIDYLTKFGILINYDLEIDKLCKDLDALREKISNIADNFGISKKKINQKVENKAHTKAYEIIEQMEKDCAERKSGLIGELKIYLSILKSLGEEIPDTPINISELEKKTIPELEEYVRKIKERSSGYLREPGIKLLNFIKGEADFPNSIKINEIKRTLEILRPIFLKGIEEKS